jgi:FtsP/CotA-like multicopper oxidase with cupredoxin domain
MIRYHHTLRWIYVLALSAGAFIALARLDGPHAEAPLTEPDGLTHLWSHDGRLEVTLTAAEGKIHVGDLEVDGLTYNGLYAGPVLHIRPGDMLRVTLINRMSQPTNIHFHGFQGSPLGNSDNAHLAIAPGTTFTYEVQIPRTQPPGVYFYHSHLHGLSEHQVMGGLSGAYVVEPPAPSASGPVARLFVLKDMIFDDDTGNTRIDDELHGVVQSINGHLDTTETMRPGETRLWRFTNQSANLPFRIAIAGHRLRIVAQDGQATNDTRLVDELNIMPSARFDVLVEAGDAGNYAIISRNTITGTGTSRTSDRVLGRLIVAGEPVSPARDETAGSPNPDLRSAPIAASRTWVFTQTKTLKAKEQKFFVNGKLFDAERVDVRVPLGSVEEWTVRNDSDDLHVFHIHQLAFQVVAVNGTPVPFTGRVDDVRVPERGEVTLRLPFTDPVIVGRFMFHCHVLKHEDRGMMAQIEVYDPRPPGLGARAKGFYNHIWWWLHGVPWRRCGLGYA